MPPPLRILLVEDDDAHADVVAVQLSAAGIPVEITRVRSIAEASRQLHRSEEQLRQSQQMEAVGRLASGVAHDFNNVLTAIFGYADLLLDEFPLEDPRRADLEEIRRSAERAAALTRQLLAFSRKELSQSRVVDLNEIVGSLQKLLERLMGDRIEFVFRPATDLWKVRADPAQIEQVLVNLCANARDVLTERSRLEMTTFNEEIGEDAPVSRDGLPPGAYAVLRVSVAGPPWPRLRWAAKEQGKEIVTQSGGGIYVEAEEGVGFRFSIYLPRVWQA
jgi:two-component system, cell cycle sensor histidine kinase and response regulator CckA